MRHGVAALMVAGALGTICIRVANADLLLAPILRTSQFDNNLTIDRYSDAGTYLGIFASIHTEEIAAIDAAPNGDVYTINNILGGGQYAAFNSAGVPYAATGTNPVEVPSSIAVGGNGNALIASDKYDANGVTGIVEVNALTGAFVKTCGQPRRHSALWRSIARTKRSTYRMRRERRNINTTL